MIKLKDLITEDIVFPDKFMAGLGELKKKLVRNLKYHQVQKNFVCRLRRMVFIN